MNHPISAIKKAARRILGSYFFRCAVASFITGTGILLIFNYVLDGTMQVENAFDTEQFYQALISGTSPGEIINNIYNSLRSLAESAGYTAYMSADTCAASFAMFLAIISSIFHSLNPVSNVPYFGSV